MTSLEHPDRDLPDSLPLLTQVVEAATLDDLPTLTEIVIPDVAIADDDAPALLESAETPSLPNDASGIISINPKAAVPVPDAYGEDAMQQLVHRLEAHIETVFAQKLNQHLEQLQKIAVDQAVNELKAELPGLLRDALDAHRRSR